MCGTDKDLVVKRSPSSVTDIPSEAVNGDTRHVANLSPDAVINLDQGDPTLFESFWETMNDKCSIKFSASDLMSYMSDNKICWYMEPKLEREIKRLHNMVGNAVLDNYYLIVGNGSSQLIGAALYALSILDSEHAPINVVSAAPYYSCYPEITDILQSGLYKWAGDAQSYGDNGNPYIEFITSPNNPNGDMREGVVNGAKGKLIHDLAYYWPQYTPITQAANSDIMLFTLSKCTGHAGSRIGWALVKDMEVAAKMIYFITVGTIGVSKEAQLRAAKNLGAISDSYVDGVSTNITSNFFEYGRNLMAERWKRLKDVVKRSGHFSLSEYPLQFCNFTNDFATTTPAFAWLKYKGDEDCEKLLRRHKILTRNGKRFGSESSFVRISMLSKDGEFDLFLQRLVAIQDLINHDNAQS